MDRRDFLKTVALAACAAGCEGRRPLPPGRIVGAGAALGHRLRHHDFPAPGETLSVPVLIVGGGIAGLSAAWRLRRAGLADFRLFELEDEVGGNSRWGANSHTAYPWGAHYLPLPGRAARSVRLLLSELGALKGDIDAARPDYDERYLCFAPQERLWYRGSWQEGLLPQIGVGADDLDQYRRFADIVGRYHRAGAFTIPMAMSSQAAEYLALDRQNMRDWLLAQGLRSATLHWYVNYACRDDYGTDYSQVSAWAGLHYFASREGLVPGADNEQVLTWPQGNGWLVQRMRAGLAPAIRTGAVVYRIEEDAHGLSAQVYLADEGRSQRWRAEQLIFAAPLHLLEAIVAGLDAGLVEAARAIDYAPWLVANLTLSGAPDASRGAPLAWDNVLYDSPALGYVVATHQRLAVRPGPTVLSYYRPFAGEAPLAARQRLFDAPRERWAEEILADLARPHPDLPAKVEGIDLMRWGHAMCRPRPGLITGGARRRLLAHRSRLHLAHADLSGFSIFEEAHYRGEQAAEAVLARS